MGFYDLGFWDSFFLHYVLTFLRVLVAFGRFLRWEIFHDSFFPF